MFLEDASSEKDLSSVTRRCRLPSIIYNNRSKYVVYMCVYMDMVFGCDMTNG